jgi:hypothetical protein
MFSEIKASPKTIEIRKLIQLVTSKNILENLASENAKSH